MFKLLYWFHNTNNKVNNTVSLNMYNTRYLYSIVFDNKIAKQSNLVENKPECEVIIIKFHFQ